MSLASVLVISAKVRRFALKVLASASEAARRFLPSRVLHQGERRLDRERLAVDLEAQRRDRLVEQPVPGARAGHRLLVEQLLDAVLELIRLLLAHVLDPRPVVAERADRAIARVQRRVVDAVELEREEQQMQRGRGDPLLHVAVELGAHRIGGVAGIDEARIGDEPAEQVVERLVALHRFGELRAAVRAAASAASLPL